ncbi:uncharacterized protein TNIN_66351 [Trichonephila inaurata madagascariensis]|uniref:Gustatory receptor n=1 Tax=Trichonephila inaurata madagascariensis TaxID=2747483 RepID=A0A8X6X4P1_9ARAC|nr:uncharacterized protein TNIN_66351 [Trichonephila inaurata madagascariensis]
MFSSVLFAQSALIAVSMILLSMTSILHRLVLAKEMSQLKKIVNLLVELKPHRKSENIGWLKILAIVSTSSLLLLFAFRASEKDATFDVSTFFFGYTFNKVYNNAIFTVYDIFTTLFFVLPLMTFSFYYIAICYDIRHIIQHFGKTLSNIASDYEAIFRSYTAIKSHVNQIDNSINFLVFTVIIYNSCVMCFSLYAVLEPKMIIPMELVSSLYLLSTHFALFVLMTASASMIPEASAEIGFIASTMPEKAGRSTLSLQRFISSAEKEITLTVWKIVPIQRSFIFGISGALFTYTLMFYTLSSMIKD